MDHGEALSAQDWEPKPRASCLLDRNRSSKSENSEPTGGKRILHMLLLPRKKSC